MNIAKTLSAFSLAVAMIGGAVMLAPSSSHAGNRISNGALNPGKVVCSIKNNFCRPGKPANPPSRGCSKIAHCRD